MGYLSRLAVVVLALATLVAPASAGYVELFGKVQGAAWAIYVRTTGGMNAACSAAAYRSDGKETLLITAGHCFMGEDTARTDFLVTQDHRVFHKAALAKSGLKVRAGKSETSSNLDDFSGHDWAIVRADVSGVPVLPIGDSRSLRVGDDLVVVGVPFGMDFLGVQGILGSKDLSLSKLVWNHYFGANIYVAGGNSGSGVVHAGSGTIVGIVAAGPGAQSSMMIFTPIHLVQFPDELKP